MTGSEIILELMANDHVTQTNLARAIGVDRRNVSMLLVEQKDIKVSRFLDILSYLGYDISIRKVKYKKVNAKKTDFDIGIYWYTENGKYVAIDNSHGNMVKVTFDTEEQCKSYLMTL